VNATTLTPEHIRANIQQVLLELKKAADAIQKLEEQAERSELIADSTADMALMESAGTVDERKAQSRLRSMDQRHDAIVARAAYNRAKLKAKHLEIELMGLQSMLKSIQLEGA
jgi:hypothetical protein